jgi:ribosomal protein L9
MDKLESEMKLDKRISAEADIKLEKPIRELGRHRIPFRIRQAKGEIEIEVVKEA